MKAMNIGALVAGLLMLSIPTVTAGLVSPDASGQPAPVPERITCAPFGDPLDTICLLVAPIIILVCVIVFGLLGRQCPIN